MKTPSFLQEDSGRPSTTRIACLICILNAVALSWLDVFKGLDCTAMIVTFLSAGLTAKIIQKPMEIKPERE